MGGGRIRRRVGRAGHPARAPALVPDRATGIIPGRAPEGCMAVRDGGSPVIRDGAEAVHAAVDRPPAGDRTPGGMPARRRIGVLAGRRLGDGEGRGPDPRSARAGASGRRNPWAPGCQWASKMSHSWALKMSHSLEAAPWRERRDRSGGCPGGPGGDHDPVSSLRACSAGTARGGPWRPRTRVHRGATGPLRCLRLPWRALPLPRGCHTAFPG